MCDCACVSLGPLRRREWGIGGEGSRDGSRDSDMRGCAPRVAKLCRWTPKSRLGATACCGSALTAALHLDRRLEGTFLRPAADGQRQAGGVALGLLAKAEELTRGPQAGGGGGTGAHRGSATSWAHLVRTLVVLVRTDGPSEVYSRTGTVRLWLLLVGCARSDVVCISLVFKTKSTKTANHATTHLRPVVCVCRGRGKL